MKQTNYLASLLVNLLLMLGLANVAAYGQTQPKGGASSAQPSATPSKATATKRESSPSKATAKESQTARPDKQSGVGSSATAQTGKSASGAKASAQGSSQAAGSQQSTAPASQVAINITRLDASQAAGGATVRVDWTLDFKSDVVVDGFVVEARASFDGPGTLTMTVPFGADRRSGSFQFNQAKAPMFIEAKVTGNFRRVGGGSFQVVTSQSKNLRPPQPVATPDARVNQVQLTVADVKAAGVSGSARDAVVSTSWTVAFDPNLGVRIKEFDVEIIEARFSNGKIQSSRTTVGPNQRSLGINLLIQAEGKNAAGDSIFPSLVSVKVRVTAKFVDANNNSLNVVGPPSFIFTKVATRDLNGINVGGGVLKVSPGIG